MLCVERCEHYLASYELLFVGRTLPFCLVRCCLGTEFRVNMLVSSLLHFNIFGLIFCSYSVFSISSISYSRRQAFGSFKPFN